MDILRPNETLTNKSDIDIVLIPFTLLDWRELFIELADIKNNYSGQMPLVDECPNVYKLMVELNEMQPAAQHDK